MELWYEGRNITRYVQIRRCVVRDAAGGRCDSLEAEFEDAAGWRRWGPQEDDRILAALDGYDSGEMFVHSVQAENGRYRITASSLPCAARQRRSRSFTGRTVAEIVDACAMDCGMDRRLFGLDENAPIPYLQQENESAAAFLDRFLRLEGAALKCVNGRFAAIGIAWAQARAAARTLDAGGRGVQYHRSGTAARSLTVRTPYAEATASDDAVPDTHIRVVTGAPPARSDVQAGRWARGLLLDRNRRCEIVTMASVFQPAMTAMTRIDLVGDTDAAGRWLVELAEHELVSGSTVTRLVRCVESVR